MSKKVNVDKNLSEANLWLKEAFANLFEAHHKKQLSKRIKLGLKNKKEVLEKAKRSYNTRNIKK
jgi:hypothetical protein